MNNSDVTDLGVLVSRVAGLEARMNELEKFFDLKPVAKVEVAQKIEVDQKIDVAQKIEVDQKIEVGAKIEFAPTILETPVIKTTPAIEQLLPIQSASVTQPNSDREPNSVRDPNSPDQSWRFDVTPPKQDEVLEETQKPKESLENRIGLYWLSKLGIAFLVVGVCLLIMYTFQNFGPEAKIATGFITASILMAVGEYLERRDNIPWYARLLEGGAWAMGYFTTYAMYHVQSVRIISDPLTDLILMLGVSGLAIAHSINKRSEMMAIFSVTLGFLTLALSHVTAFSATSSAILVLIAAILSTRQKWYQLYLYSVFASYGALIACGSLHLTGPNGLRESFQLASLLLGPSLIGFGLVPLWLSEKDRLSKQTIVIGTIVNASAFCSLFFPLAYDYLGSGAAVYNLTIGLWFFAVAILAKRSGVNATAAANSLFALTVSTLYFSGAHYGRGTWIFLAGELAVLAWAGLRFELKSFRWFAVMLGFLVFIGNLFLMGGSGSTQILGHYLPFSICSGLCTVAALSFSAYLQKKPSLQNNAGARERNFSFYWNWSMALMIGWLLPVAMVSVTFDHLGRIADYLQTSVLLFSWCGIAAAVMAMAIRMRNTYMQIITILLFATAGIPACSIWQFSWVNSALAVAIMFAAAFVFRHYAPRLSASKSMANFQAQFLVAYCCAALLPWAAQWASEPTAVYLSVQALVALCLGIHMRDKFVRLITPVAFAFSVITMGLHSLAWSCVIPIVTCFYLAWALYHLPGEFGIVEGDREIRHIYSIAAGVVLTSFLGHKLETTWISCAWSLQGFATLALGFVMRDKVLRFTGLFVFASLVYRLLFIDLAGAETIYRIFAFIVAGLALLLSAYAYSEFSKRFDGAGDSIEPPRAVSVPKVVLE